MNKNNGRELRNSLIYVGIIYSLSLVLWILWYFGFDRSITVQSGFFGKLLYNSDVFYFIIWFIPAFLLFLYASLNRKKTVSSAVPFEQIFSKPISVKFVLLFIVIIFVIILCIKLFRTGLDFSAVDISYGVFRSALYAAITEEFIYRASYQNVLRSKLNKHITFLIVAVLFTVSHIPDWIYGGMLAFILQNGLFLIHFGLSLFFSYSFEKSNNLVVPIIFHFCWNLFAGIFKV